MNGFRQHIIRRDELGLVLHIEEGVGPLVFFQHGLCGEAAQPVSVFPRGCGARLAVLDCRGHGDSPAGAPEAFSIATFTADLAAAIEEVSSLPAVVGGISMGAAIAMRLACLRPELVSGLVLARPAWATAAAPENMAPNRLVGNCLRQPPLDGELHSFIDCEAGRLLAADAPDNLASLAGFFRRAPRAVTAELLHRISRDGPGVTQAQLAALAIPTLVIGHGEDVIHPLALARQLAGLIPGAGFLEIPPKASNKPGYESAFRAGLGRFLKEMLHETSSKPLV